MGNNTSTATTSRKTVVRITHGNGKETSYTDEDENTYSGSSNDVKEMVTQTASEYVNSMKVGLEGAAENRRALQSSSTNAIQN